MFIDTKRKFYLSIAVVFAGAFSGSAKAQEPVRIVVGLPIPVQVGPMPPGMPSKPPPRPVLGVPVYGMPSKPPPRPVLGVPVYGMPSLPPPVAINEYELFCNAVVGNRSGFDRLKLRLTFSGGNTYQAVGSLRYFNGAQLNIVDNGWGTIRRGHLNLAFTTGSRIVLRPTRLGVTRSDLRGDLTFYGTMDRNGMNCDISRD